MNEMSEFPKYEVWGEWLSDHHSEPHFVEDCFSLKEARQSAEDYRKPYRSAWVVDKETGEMVK